MSSVSQPFIKSQLGLVPRSPIEPVTYGSSSGTTALPRSAFATPARSRSATAITSSVASSAPAPTSMATFLPLLRTSAAARRSACSGNLAGPA